MIYRREASRYGRLPVANRKVSGAVIAGALSSASEFYNDLGMAKYPPGGCGEF
jgi:hypothetical protein